MRLGFSFVATNNFNECFGFILSRFVRYCFLLITIVILERIIGYLEY